MLFPLQSGRSKTASRRARFFRPQLEGLEDRSVPSTVTNLNDAGAGSLRQAILDTPVGGTVDFEPGLSGTIALSSGELAITKDLTIAGPGAETITVSGSHYSRVFNIAATFTIGIIGLTIADGNVVNADGGGILNAGTLALGDCIVSNNSALDNSSFSSTGNGGGISSNGTLSVSNSLLDNNSAHNNTDSGIGSERSGNGGGIYSIGTLTVSNSTISNNSAENTDMRSSSSGEGGGISSRGTLSVSNSAIRDNFLANIFGTGSAMYSLGGLNLGNNAISGNRGPIAVDYHGGITTISDCSVTGNTIGACIEGDGTLTVSNSTIAGNGGGVVHAGPATVSNSTIAGNAGYGFSNIDTLTVSNSTIAGNSVGGIEDIAFSNNATVLLISTTVAGNGDHQLFAESGFGMPVGTATIQLRNTIVSGDGHSANLAVGPAGTFSSLGHNLSSDSGGGFLTGPGDLTNIDPRLGQFQDNGGPTQTMALLAGSPALDTGDPAQSGVADQRGVVRSGGVNIGAYQASASSFIVTAEGTVTAGSPFDVSVTAVDPFGQTAVGYTGTATFSSADPYGATLPADHTFTAVDAGVYPFPGGATLYTAGAWDVTATDTVTASLTGSAFVFVNPAAAHHLLFLQQPTDTAAGQTITPAVTVAVVDQFGNVLTGDNTDTVTISIGANPSGGTLSGALTLTVSGGIATFDDLSIDMSGDGYTLHASTTGLTDADSVGFSITT
jgi:hypothetical protein